MKKFSFKAHLFSMGLLCASLGAFAQNGITMAGAGNYVSLGAIAPFGTGDFTVETTFKTTVTPSPTSMALLSNRPNSCTSQCSNYWNLVINVNGEVQFEVSEDAACTNYNSVASTGLRQNDGLWHHVAAVRSGGTLRLYIDGALNSVATTNVVNLTSTVTPTIGSAVTCPSSFNGSMDEVRIWNRALAACEIASYRTCELPSNVGLARYYQCNAGATMTDNSTFGVAGVVTGAVTADATSPVTGTCAPAYPTVTITPTPAGAAVCQGASVSLAATAVAGATYQWKKDGTAIAAPAGTAATYAATASGTYTVDVTTGSGCLVTPAPSQVVTIHPIPTAAVTPAGPISTCANVPVTLTTNTVTGATYQWYNAGTAVGAASASPTYSATVAGTYTVITTANGCASPASNVVTVTTTAVPTTPTIAALTSTTFCEGNNVVLNATAVTGTYQWYKNAVAIPTATTASYTATTAGNYTFSVTSGGCTATSALTTVTVNPKPIPTFTIASPGLSTVCPNTPVTITASGGVSYVWPGNGAGATTATITVTPAMTLTYTVNVTDANGCTAAASQNIFVTPLSTTLSANRTTICEGETALLTANPSPAGTYTYVWKNGGTVVAGVTSATYLTTAAGSYTVEVSSASCTATSPATVITVNPLPTASFSGAPVAAICQNTSITLTGTSDIGATYEWRKDGVTIAGATGLTYTFPANTTGSYTFVAIAATGCAKNSLPQTITVTPAPSAVISGADFVCNGSTTLLSAPTLTPASDFTFQWVNNGTNVAAPAGIAATYAAAGAGPYTLVVRQTSTTCSATSAAKTLTVKPILGATIAIASNPICAGATTTLTASPGPQVGATTHITYVWERTAGAPVGILTDTTRILTTGIAGTYKLSATELNGCVTTASQVLTVNPIGAGTIAGGPTTFCQGNNVVLTVTPSAGGGGTYTYQWKKDGNDIATATSAAYTATMSGAYSVAVTGANGCPGTTAATTVTVNPVPNAIITPATPSVCQGGTSTLTANAGTGLTYQWYKNNVLETGQTAQTYSAVAPLSTDQYFVAVTSAAGCTNTSVPSSFTINPIPTSPIAANSATTLCVPTATVQLDANPLASLTKQWYKNGNPVGGNTVSHTVTYAEAGSYTVRVTDANGCTELSNPIVVSTGTAAPATITTPSPICAGSVLTANAGTGLTYQWQTGSPLANISGATAATHTAATAGSYAVVVTAANGCPTTSTATVVNAIPVATATAANLTTFCAGLSDVLNVNTTTGATYQWQNNGVDIPVATAASATTSNLTVVASGNYRAVVTFAGCSATSNVIPVTVNPLPSISGAVALCTPGSNTLTASIPAAPAAVPTLQWYLNGGAIGSATATTYAATTAGTYKVVATYGVITPGCSSTDLVVTATATPTNAVVTTTACLDGTTPATLTANPAPALPAGTVYTYAWASATTAGGAYTATGTTTAAQSVTNGGTRWYKVTVISNGCTSESTPSRVTWNALPTGTIAAGGATTFCDGGNVQLTATPSPAGVYTYQWKKDNVDITGATTSPYNATMQGSHHVVGTDVNGCKFTSTGIIVTVNARPTAVATASATNVCSGTPVTFTANTGVALTYKWRKADGAGVMQDISPLVTTSTYQTTVTGTYDVHVSNASCQNTSAPITISAGALPASSITNVAPPAVCAGTTVTLTANTLAGATRKWFKDAVEIVGATGATYAATEGGLYTVETSDGTCKAVSSAATVLVNATPVITTVTPTTFCAGNSVVLSTPVVAGATYQWKKGATTLGTAANETVNTGGSYTVSVTANGKACASTATAVTVNANPIPTLTAGGSLTICQFATVPLNIEGFQGSSPYTYLWSANAGNSTSRDINAAPGNYTVTVTDANNCTAVVTETVTAIAAPAATVTAGATTFCAGGSVVLTGATTAGATYQWEKDNLPIALATGNTYTATATGVYKFVATGAGPSSCPNSSTTSVTVYAVPTATVAQGAALCPGGTTTLTAAPAGAGYTYQWFKDGSAIAAASGATYAANAAGSYTVSVTNGGIGACSNLSATPAVVTVSTPAVPTITAPSTAFCAGGNAVLTSSAATSYQWYFNNALVPAATAATYTATAAGVYTVAATYATGCTATSATTTTTINASPAAVLVAAGPTAFCAGGNVTLNANAGTGLTYEWLNNGVAIVPAATGASYTANTAGSYAVKVTDANTCTSTSTATSVVVNATPTATATANGAPTTFCPGGNVTLSANAGEASYQWLNNGATIAGATASTYTANAAGTYSVVVSSIAACTATSTGVTVAISALPTAAITAGGATTFCEGGNVALNANTGTGLTYVWKNNGTVIAGATTSNYTTNATGTYTVVVTDNATGCSNTSTASTVTVNALPAATIAAGGATTFCAGGNVALNANTGTGLTYVWSNNGAAIAGANTASYTANATGTYTVAVTNANGCSTASTATAVTVNALPAATVTAGGATTFCAGGNVALNANTGTGLTYVWKNNGTDIAGATTSSYTANAAGTYTVVVTNSATGCSTTSTASTVTVNALPAATIAAGGATTFCAGGSVALNANTGTGLTYVWSNNGAAIAGANTASYTANATGTYTVAVTNANGCSTASTATAVTVNALPAATVTAGGATSFCVGGNVTLTANTGAGLNYQWRNNGTAIAGATTGTYTASTSGSYTVAVTNSNGCQTVSAATAVSANAAPAATVTTVSPTTFCQGGNVVLSAPAAAGSSYQWLKNGANIATGANYVANTSGAYAVIVTDVNGCIATSGSTTVTVNALPTAAITAVGNTALCQGDNVTLNVTGGTSYAWSTGSTATSLTVNTAGAYSVTVTNAAGCTAAATQQVSVNALPVATSAAAGATTFCAGGSVALNANTGAGLSYQWSNNGTSIAGATAATYAANAAGAYTVVVTDANRCRNTSNATTVTVNAAPTPALTTSRSPNLCPGDNVTLTIAGGTSYLWSTGATTTSVTASTAGNYTVTVTNAAGCTATASQAVVINTLPLSTITAGGLTSFCPGDNVALSAPVGSNYTYQWRNNGTAIAGATNRIYSATAAGSYTVLVTESVTGCNSASPAPIAVTVFARPTVSFTRTVQTGTTSVVDLVNTSSAGTVLWSFGDAANSTSTQQNPTFWYRTAGTYSIKLKVTNASGCVDSLVQTVVVTVRTNLSELEEALKAVAYPNPFSDRLVIEVQNPQVAFSNNDRLVVTNGLGQIVHTAPFNQKMIEISTSEWAVGIYNLTIYSNGKVIPMKKVVKIAQ